MTLRQLEVFLAVAEAHSFRKAADTLALSQPALSQHVKELEGELGARVFDRLGRTVALTGAGRFLEGHARQVFAVLRDVKVGIGEMVGLQRGSLTLGSSTTPGIYVLPGLIERFRRAHPHIEVALQIANTGEIEERIGANRLDLGIVGGHIQEKGAICEEARLEDELVLIVPPRHPFFGRATIPPGRLKDERLIVREAGSATRQVTERLLHRAGVEVRVAMELGHTEAIKQGVMAGLGVAIVSSYAVRQEVRERRLSAVRLRGVPLRRHFHVIRHEAKHIAPATQAFLQLLQTAIGHAVLKKG